MIRSEFAKSGPENLTLQGIVDCGADHYGYFTWLSRRGWCDGYRALCFGLFRNANAIYQYRLSAYPVRNPLGALPIDFSLIRNFSLASAPLEIVSTAISRPGIFKGIRGAAEKDADAALTGSGSKS